jgi:hypothetical protein
VTWGLALAGLAALALAGCGSGTVVISSPTPTATMFTPPTATPSPTPAVATVSDTQIACPITVSGDQKIFFDAETGLKFSFPASLTEQQCKRVVLSDGSESIWVGNLFNLAIYPRAGLTIPQWVNQQTDHYEIVTLGPLVVAHAESAASVKDEPAPTPGPRPFDAEPFSNVPAIIAGTQRFYVIHTWSAMINSTDSTAPLGPIIATFDVP